MTQADFASRLGVTGAAVSAYETGNRLPSYEVLVKIANILGVSTDALLGPSERRPGGGGRHLPHPRQRSLVQDMVEEFAAGNRRGMPCDVGVPRAGHPGHPAGGHGSLCPGQRLLPPPRTQLAVPGPPAVFFVSVYLWTWFWEDSAYKIAVTLLLTFLAYKGLTKQPAMAILAGMMTQQIYLAAANALAETAAFFLLDEMTVVVEGQQFLRPVVYGLYFLFQIAFMLFFRFFLRKYAGGLDKRSVLAIALPLPAD